MTLNKMEKIIKKGTKTLPISNLEQVVQLINLNVDAYEFRFAALVKKLRRINAYSIIAIAGVTYAISKLIKHDEELDKLHFRLNELENKEEEE